MKAALRRVVVRAPGKINLSLGVGGVDEHGYHALATVFQAVDLHETITAERADGMSLEISSDVPGEIPLDGSNLVLRAAELLRTESAVTDSAALHVHKQVPIAGGMGGGSADAAATLVALDRLWGLDLGTERLRQLGGRLGADVPFAMLGHTALGRGNGADLTPLPTRGTWTWLLAVPGGHLSTPQVFRTFDENAERSGRIPPHLPTVDERQLAALARGDLPLLAETLHNDLQAAAFALHPGLEPVVTAAKRLGAPAALVSGSGPTIAVLVEDEAQAQEIAAGLLGEGLVDSCLVVRGAEPGARVLVEQ